MKTLFSMITEVFGFLSALVVLVISVTALTLSLLTRRVSEWLLDMARALLKLMSHLTGHEKEINVDVETN